MSITVKEFKQMISKINDKFDNMELKVLIDDDLIKENMISARIGEDLYNKYLDDENIGDKKYIVETLLERIDECLKFDISKYYSLEYRQYGVLGEIEPNEFLLVVGDNIDNMED